MLPCTSVPLCFPSGQAESTEQWSCHAAQWEGRAQHLALSCFASGLFRSLCALLADLTGSPCAAFSARAEVQAGHSWAAAASVLHSPQPPCLGVQLACCRLTEALKQRTVIWALGVPSAPCSVRLPLLELQGCTGPLISTAAQMVRF